VTERAICHHVTVADGTRVFATLHRGDDAKIPLLCLAGLTRNGRDFEPVVAEFAGSRTIITMDFRGRGRSDAAADPLTYRPDVELADTFAVLADLEIARVALLGTSRGGIVGMLMAASRPEVLAGLFLNDIGPRIEIEGLLKIIAYVGVEVSYPDWPSAAQAFAQARTGFMGVDQAQWQAVVKRAYVEREGRIFPDYDLRLSATQPAVEAVAAGKVPELWSIMPSLAAMPVSVLRGANSDLLSASTVARLEAELPHLDATSVPGRGHVPFLDEAESVGALRRWLARVDAAG
jgi:pimeloyl-ACP methyl ester carboxylesterase